MDKRGEDGFHDSVRLDKQRCAARADRLQQKNVSQIHSKIATRTNLHSFAQLMKRRDENVLRCENLRRELPIERGVHRDVCNDAN